MRNSILCLITVMIFSVSCNNESICGDNFSTKLLKQNSLEVDNGEHTYVVECKDQGVFWGTIYFWIVNDERSSDAIISKDVFFFEEEWFDITASEDLKSITIHVQPNLSDIERKIVINVRRANTTSHFTLIQKK